MKPISSLVAQKALFSVSVVKVRGVVVGEHNSLDDRIFTRSATAPLFGPDRRHA